MAANWWQMSPLIVFLDHYAGPIKILMPSAGVGLGISILNPVFKSIPMGPGWVTRLVRSSSQYAKVVCLIPGHGTHKNQPMSA